MTEILRKTLDASLCLQQVEDFTKVQERRHDTAFAFPSYVRKRTEHIATVEESRLDDARGQNPGAARRDPRPP